MSIIQSAEQTGKSRSEKVLETGGKLYDTRVHSSHRFCPDIMDIPILIQRTIGAQKYGVTVPDIPGCVTTGETVDKAMSNATKAIYGHVGQLVEQGKSFEIRPSEVESLLQEPGYVGGIWALVSLDLARLDDPPQG